MSFECVIIKARHGLLAGNSCDACGSIVKSQKRLLLYFSFSLGHQSQSSSSGSAQSSSSSSGSTSLSCTSYILKQTPQVTHTSILGLSEHTAQFKCYSGALNICVYLNEKFPCSTFIRHVLHEVFAQVSLD